MDTIRNIERAHQTVWCQCCRDADCPKHMGHTDTAVPCVVCGELCQCVGCAANLEPAQAEPLTV